MKKILYNTIYDSNPFGHGGEKRTSQIEESLKLSSCEIEKYRHKGTYSFTPYYALKSLIVIINVYGIFTWKSMKTFFSFWINFSSWISEFDCFLKDDSSEKLIWENTQAHFYFVPYLAKKRKKQIIAFPHNIESLVSGQSLIINANKQEKAFSKEIEIFKQCDIVYTISREEAVMLKLFGVNAYYFPYYPPREAEDYLLKLRERRKEKTTTSHKKILMLGSALNKPTLIGMKNRIEWFEKNNFENVELFIAGYGTEQLEKIVSPKSKSIKLLGKLSIEQLEQEYLQADAILIHQPATTGALTRIMEALIAGIPVLVNEESARSYYDMNGVFVYQNDEQLKKYLIQDLKMPSLPEKVNFDFC